MNKLKTNIAIKLDLLLVVFWVVVYLAFKFMNYNVDLVFVLVTCLGTLFFVHFSILQKVLKPLQAFIEIADKVADGDIHEGLNDLRMSDLEEVQGSFTKIVGSMIESHAAIEDYMQKISDINRELEQKVDSLSAIYYAS